MSQIRRLIKKLMPKPMLRNYLAYQIRTGKMPHSGWSGNYSSWKEAKNKCEGYDEKSILEKVLQSVLKVKRGEAAYERDSVAFDKLEYSKHVLSALLSHANEHESELDLIDFGGSLGSTYFQYRSLLKNLKKISWSVVEQAHFVDKGKSYVAGDGLQFYYDLNEVLNEHKPKLLLLFSVLNYLEKPYELLETFLDAGFTMIIIDRTGFIEDRKERLTVQSVPDFIYKASYPAWFFNEKKFRNFIEERGYLISKEYDSEFANPRILDDGRRVYWKGFILKRERRLS